MLLSFATRHNNCNRDPMVFLSYWLLDVAPDAVIPMRGKFFIH